MADILTQEEIDNLLGIGDVAEGSPFMKSYMEQTISSFESILSFGGVSSSNYDIDLNKESYLELSLFICEITLNDDSKIIIAIPTPFATILLDCKGGGAGESSEQIDEDGLEILKNVISTILEKASLEFDDLSFKIDNVFFSPAKTKYSIGDLSTVVLYTLQVSSFESNIFFIADNVAMERLEIVKSEEIYLLNEYEQNEWDIKVEYKENISEIISIKNYSGLDSISKKVSFEKPYEIYEFDNETIITCETKHRDDYIKIYSRDGELVQEINDVTFIGLHNNELYFIDDTTMNIYDENLNIVDSYEIEEIDRFKEVTFFNDKIITSEDSIAKDGMDNMEDNYTFIDSDINVWERGKIQRTLKNHPFGARTYVLDSYLVTYGLDGNNIWDKDFNLLGSNKDIKSFKMLDEKLALSDDKLLDFNLLLHLNKDEKYIENNNINGDSGVVIEERSQVITYGFKTIYLWDKSSYSPLKQYNSSSQIIYFKRFDTKIVIKTIGGLADKRVYVIFDLSLNELYSFQQQDSDIYMLENSNNFILSYTKHNFPQANTYSYIIVDVQKRELVEKSYDKTTYFSSADKESYCSIAIDHDTLYIKHFSRDGKIISDDRYQNNYFNTYHHDLGINFYKEDSKDIFWYETAKHNDIGRVLVCSIKNNVLQVKIFQYDYTQRRVPSPNWQTTPPLTQLRIVDNQYIFSNDELEFVCDEDGLYLGYKRLKSYDEIENAQLFKALHDNEKSLIPYEKSVIKRVDDTCIVINDSGRVKYLQNQDVDTTPIYIQEDEDLVEYEEIIYKDEDTRLDIPEVKNSTSCLVDFYIPKELSKYSGLSAYLDGMVNEESILNMSSVALLLKVFSFEEDRKLYHKIDYFDSHLSNVLTQEKNLLFKKILEFILESNESKKKYTEDSFNKIVDDYKDTLFKTYEKRYTKFKQFIEDIYLNEDTQDRENIKHYATLDEYSDEEFDDILSSYLYKANIYGVLGIESEIADEKNRYIKKYINLIIDGHSPDEVSFLINRDEVEVKKEIEKKIEIIKIGMIRYIYRTCDIQRNTNRSINDICFKELFDNEIEDELFEYASTRIQRL